MLVNLICILNSDNSKRVFWQHLYTVQPHYNMPHYSAVFNITHACHGSQNVYLTICLLWISSL